MSDKFKLPQVGEYLESGVPDDGEFPAVWTGHELRWLDSQDRSVVAKTTDVGMRGWVPVTVVITDGKLVEVKGRDS